MGGQRVSDLNAAELSPAQFDALWLIATAVEQIESLIGEDSELSRHGAWAVPLHKMRFALRTLRSQDPSDDIDMLLLFLGCATLEDLPSQQLYDWLELRQNSPVAHG